MPPEPVEPAAAVDRLQRRLARAGGGLPARPRGAELAHRLVEGADEEEGGLVCGGRRVGQRVRRRLCGEVALVEGELADRPRLAGGAVEVVLKLVGVVEDPVAEREAVQLRGGGEGAWLDLEVAEDLVAKPDGGGGDRVAPHLDHPAEGAVGLRVRLELDRRLAPRPRHLLEVGPVDEHGRRADRLHLLVARLAARRPDPLDKGRVGRVGAHVAEEVRHRRAALGAIRDGLQQHVVRLCDEEVLLLQRGVAGRLEEVSDAAGPVDDAVAVEARDVGRLVLGREMRRYLRLEPVRTAAWRRDQPREAGQLGAAARRVGVPHAHPVVIHDAALPRLVVVRRGGQHHVERLARCGTPLRCHAGDVATAAAAATAAAGTTTDASGFDLCHVRTTSCCVCGACASSDERQSSCIWCMRRSVVQIRLRHRARPLKKRHACKREQQKTEVPLRQHRRTVGR
mmetsp:Transcript_14271/g.48004  ORF Transcript_14271/g.48004 Transcript_14271/m.48004 type:complete len:454 (+) Transcript_14271:511-1872(+)